MRRRIDDVRALHDLLSYHIDDLEDVMAALRETYGPEAALNTGTAPFPTHTWGNDRGPANCLVI